MGAQTEERCVIIAAGPMGDYARIRQRVAFCDTDHIVCVDGGLNHAHGLGVRPSVVIGDLDSATVQVPDGVRLIRFKSEKDETDMVLAIRYALERGFRRILIVGGLQGRLDHTYANFCALYELAKSGAEGAIVDADNEAMILLPGSMRIPKREGSYVSVFPFGERAEGVCERGMKYSLSDATLVNDFPLGVSNEFSPSSPCAEISVRKGPLLIILSGFDTAR